MREKKNGDKYYNVFLMIFFRFNAAAPRSFIKQAIEIGLGALYLVSIFFATSSKLGGSRKPKIC